jgi:uncharacterized protein YdhG (YjbR/CyaY superfamily)
MRGVSAKDVDDYLAAVPEDARVSLSKLRETIRAIVPDATEAISYQIPIFKYRGRGLVGFSASKDHCTFQVMSPAVVEAHRKDLQRYELGKGSVQFPAGTTLPAALVKKLVKARIAENEAGWSGYRAKAKER